jgi:hypothetical protein
MFKINNFTPNQNIQEETSEKVNQSSEMSVQKDPSLTEIEGNLHISKYLIPTLIDESQRSYVPEQTYKTHRYNNSTTGKFVNNDIKNNDDMHLIRNPKFRKRNVISAITRQADSISNTRPSTARLTMSKRPISRGNNIRDLKQSAAISENVTKRTKPSKLRPKTGVNIFSNKIFRDTDEVRLYYQVGLTQSNRQKEILASVILK